MPAPLPLVLGSLPANQADPWNSDGMPWGIAIVLLVAALTFFAAWWSSRCEPPAAPG